MVAVTGQRRDSGGGCSNGHQKAAYGLPAAADALGADQRGASPQNVRLCQGGLSPLPASLPGGALSPAPADKPVQIKNRNNLLPAGLGFQTLHEARLESGSASDTELQQGRRLPQHRSFTASEIMCPFGWLERPQGRPRTHPGAQSVLPGNRPARGNARSAGLGGGLRQTAPLQKHSDRILLFFPESLRESSRRHRGLTPFPQPYHLIC